jgi:predicted  nucleic acid-binding Zn-ribbon protein
MAITELSEEFKWVQRKIEDLYKGLEDTRDDVRKIKDAISLKSGPLVDHNDRLKKVEDYIENLEWSLLRGRL